MARRTRRATAAGEKAFLVSPSCMVVGLSHALCFVHFPLKRLRSGVSFLSVGFNEDPEQKDPGEAEYTLQHFKRFMPHLEEYEVLVLCIDKDNINGPRLRQFMKFLMDGFGPDIEKVKKVFRKILVVRTFANEIFPTNVEEDSTLGVSAGVLFWVTVQKSQTLVEF